MESLQIIPELLHKEMINFIDSLKSIFEENQIDDNDLIYIEFFITKMQPSDAMNHIIDKVLPFSNYIKTRSDNFFYKNKNIFGKLPEDKVNYFSDLWKNNKLKQEDKDEIWEYFEAFIGFAERFKKKD